MCSSCPSLRALCLVFKPLSSLCSSSDHCGLWLPVSPVFPASPVFCYWVLPACLPPADLDRMIRPSFAPAVALFAPSWRLCWGRHAELLLQCPGWRVPYPSGQSSFSTPVFLPESYMPLQSDFGDRLKPPRSCFQPQHPVSCFLPLPPAPATSLLLPYGLS